MAALLARHRSRFDCQRFAQWRIGIPLMYEGAMRLISHSGRTRSFDLSKLIARVTARGDRSGEREPCTSYRLFGELCAGSSRRVTGLSCITCAAPARNGSSGTDRSARDKRFRFTELISAEFASLGASRGIDGGKSTSQPPSVMPH